MGISDFLENWERIEGLVRSEYQAVEGREGYYTLDLDLSWECFDEDEDDEPVVYYTEPTVEQETLYDLLEKYKKTQEET